LTKPKTTVAELADDSENFPLDLDSDPTLADEDAAGGGEKGGKRASGKVAPRRFPLPIGSSPEPARLTKLEAEILGSVKAMVDDIEVLDKQIDEMHQLLGQLMFGTRKAVGVAWSAHRTRAGLHPVAYRQSPSNRAVVKLSNGKAVKRFWVTELNPPVRLSRFALGDPASDEWLVRAQKDVLRALERLLALRARAMRCLAGKRVAVGAWAQQVRPGLHGTPAGRVAPAFETKALVKRIDLEHFVRVHRRGVSLGESMQAGAAAAREQDEADLAQRPR